MERNRKRKNGVTKEYISIQSTVNVTVSSQAEKKVGYIDKFMSLSLIHIYGNLVASCRSNQIIQAFEIDGRQLVNDNGWFESVSYTHLIKDYARKISGLEDATDESKRYADLIVDTSKGLSLIHISGLAVVLHWGKHDHLGCNSHEIET